MHKTIIETDNIFVLPTGRRKAILLELITNQGLRGIGEAGLPVVQAANRRRSFAAQRTLMKNRGGSHIDYFGARYLIQRLRKRPPRTSSA